MNRSAAPWRGLIAAALLAGASAAASDDALSSYRTTVEPVLKRFCIDCHGGAKAKGGVDLAGLRAASDPSSLALWERVERSIAEGDMPPPAAREKPAGSQRDALLRWITGWLDRAARTQAGDPGVVPMRRLTRVEYRRSIQALTGRDIAVDRILGDDPLGGDGFASDGAVQQMTPASVEQYLTAARVVAAHATASPVSGLRFHDAPAGDDAGERPAAAAFQELNRFLGAHRRPNERKVPLDSAKNLYKGNLMQAFGLALPDGIPLRACDLIQRDRPDQEAAKLDYLPPAEVEQARRLWRDLYFASRQPYARKIAILLARFKTVPIRDLIAAIDRAIGGFADVDAVIQALPPIRKVLSQFGTQNDDAATQHAALFCDRLNAAQRDALWARISRGDLALPPPAGASRVSDAERIRWSEADAECRIFDQEQATAAHRLLIDFASQAFRCQLKPEEIAQLASFLADVASTEFTEMMRAGIVRVLTSPRFLYRIEAVAPSPGPHPLSDRELASRLSFMLWAAPPDAELRGLAERGELGRPEAITAQVGRMLRDPRVDGLVAEFFGRWLRFRVSEDGPGPDPVRFPEYDRALRGDLQREAERFLADVIRNDLPVATLLSARHSFLNERLAKHYGVGGVTGDAFRKVDLSATRRQSAGILSLGATLAATSPGGRSSPVKRGYFVRTVVLGQSVPPPPPAVPELPTKPGADGPRSMRQLLDAHRTDANCAACHVRIDPYGLALENFDAIGRWRSVDEHGLAIDVAVTLPDGAMVTGPQGLAAHLAADPTAFQQQLCRKLIAYALGRPVQRSDQSLVADMLSALRRDGGRFSALIRTLVLSPQFCRRRGSGPPR